MADAICTASHAYRQMEKGRPASRAYRHRQRGPPSQPDRLTYRLVYTRPVVTMNFHKVIRPAYINIVHRPIN